MLFLRALLGKKLHFRSASPSGEWDREIESFLSNSFCFFLRLALHLVTYLECIWLRTMMFQTLEKSLKNSRKMWKLERSPQMTNDIGIACSVIGVDDAALLLGHRCQPVTYVLWIPSKSKPGKL
ncbi:hypothetical protein JRQ81_015305 [Phrynocephalus forsythii]|uniref:Uncharacterized protein n=1 Tax=Phrynocephalus forsythii TaxID=171643 RepID=A0A9Q0XWZ6_9SAUR|nr:hypothetical protein JRQ81_015305 [Phrynocephalus forsythii]